MIFIRKMLRPFAVCINFAAIFIVPKLLGAELFVEFNTPIISAAILTSIMTLGENQRILTDKNRNYHFYLFPLLVAPFLLNNLLLIILCIPFHLVNNFLNGIMVKTGNHFYYDLLLITRAILYILIPLSGIYLELYYIILLIFSILFYLKIKRSTKYEIKIVFFNKRIFDVMSVYSIFQSQFVNLLFISAKTESLKFGYIIIQKIFSLFSNVKSILYSPYENKIKQNFKIIFIPIGVILTTFSLSFIPLIKEYFNFFLIKIIDYNPNYNFYLCIRMLAFISLIRGIIDTLYVFKEPKFIYFSITSTIIGLIAVIYLSPILIILIILIDIILTWKIQRKYYS